MAGFGYAALTVSGATHLYSLQLNSAVTYDVGPIGAGTTAIVLVIWTWIGPERRDVDFVAEAQA